MTSAGVIEIIAKSIYIGGYASLLFIPYWMCKYFSHEKKKQTQQ
ncbi:hypothetical protein [Bacillus sp. JJ722]